MIQVHAHCIKIVLIPLGLTCVTVNQASLPVVRIVLVRIFNLVTLPPNFLLSVATAGNNSQGFLCSYSNRRGFEFLIALSNMITSHRFATASFQTRVIYKRFILNTQFRLLVFMRSSKALMPFSLNYSPLKSS